MVREREREGGRAEKKSGVESVVFVYSTRQKFFSLKDKFQFYYDIIDDYSFPNIFSELLWNVLYLLLSTHRRIIIKNLRARKIYENVRLTSEASIYIYIYIYCRKFNRHLKIDTSTGGLRFLRNTVCTMYVRSRISFLGHSKRKLPPTVSSLVVLPHVNKSTAWIHNCVSSAVLLCTQKRVCTDEDIDDTSVCTCVRMRERKRERESELKPSLGSLIMETILLQCEKGEKGWLVTAHATLRCRLPTVCVAAWISKYVCECAHPDASSTEHCSNKIDRLH